MYSKLYMNPFKIILFGCLALIAPFQRMDPIALDYEDNTPDIFSFTPPDTDTVVKLFISPKGITRLPTSEEVLLEPENHYVTSNKGIEYGITDTGKLFLCAICRDSLYIYIMQYREVSDRQYMFRDLHNYTPSKNIAIESGDVDETFLNSSCAFMQIGFGGQNWNDQVIRFMAIHPDSCSFGCMLLFDVSELIPFKSQIIKYLWAEGKTNILDLIVSQPEEITFLDLNTRILVYGKISLTPGSRLYNRLMGANFGLNCLYTTCRGINLSMDQYPLAIKELLRPNVEIKYKIIADTKIYIFKLITKILKTKQHLDQ